MQEIVKEFNKGRSPLSAEERLLDVQSELGELSKEILKSTNYGEKQFKVTDGFKEEFGDVLYALLSLASEQGINAEEVLDKVICKMKERFSRKNHIGSEE